MSIDPTATSRQTRARLGRSDPVLDAIKAKGIGKHGDVPGNAQLRNVNSTAIVPSFGMKLDPNDSAEKVPTRGFRPSVVDHASHNAPLREAALREANDPGPAPAPVGKITPQQAAALKASGSRTY